MNAWPASKLGSRVTAPQTVFHHQNSTCLTFDASAYITQSARVPQRVGHVKCFIGNASWWEMSRSGHPGVTKLFGFDPLDLDRLISTGALASQARRGATVGGSGKERARAAEDSSSASHQAAGAAPHPRLTGARRSRREPDTPWRSRPCRWQRSPRRSGPQDTQVRPSAGHDHSAGFLRAHRWVQAAAEAVQAQD